MKVSKFFKTTALGVMGVAVALAIPSDADAAKRTKWKMQSAFGGKITHLGPSAVRFSDKVKSMSEGKFVIKFHEPGGRTCIDPRDGSKGEMGFFK